MAFLSGYTDRLKLVIDRTKIEEDLVNFPVAVFLTSENHLFSKGNSNGFDTRFTASDGTTLLKYEREYHDSVNSVAKYWVKIPFVSSDINTEFYFYFRMIDTVDGAAPTSVWSNGFTGVYHMSQDPSGTAPQLLDSTQTYNCTSYGDMTSDDLVELDFSKAITFDGDDYFSNSSLRFSQNLTISAKFYVSSLGRAGCIVHQGDYAVGSNQGTALLVSANNTLSFQWYNGGAWRGVASSITISTGINVVHASFDSAALSVVFNINGINETLSVAISLSSSTYPFKIGTNKGTVNENYFIGTIDDITISNTQRSSAWLKASYNSQNYSLISNEPDIAIIESNWLDGWGNRAFIEIAYSTPGGQTYYQIKMVVSYKAGMQPDFGDVRFTSKDGITLLSYYRDTYILGSSAVFWVRIPSIVVLPKITLIFMYWYNDSVSTTSSANDTFERLIDNALCCWDFNEVSGTAVYDKLSGTINGTLNGGALRVIEGTDDNSIYFDGVDDYMSWTYTKPSNNFSISFWAKAITTHQIDTETAAAGTTTGISGQKYVFGATHEGVDAGLGVSLGTNGISVYGHGTSYMAPMAVASVAVGTGWNHIVITVTNKQPRIYLNGGLVRTGQTCVKANLYGPIRLGGDSSYGYFNGYVNDVCIFNDVLTSTEIGDLYTKQVCYYTSSYQGILVRKYADPEPSIEYVAYTTGNMCVKDPYVFSCSASGIDVYDVNLLNLVSSVSVDKLSSVWANEDYLFAGTSNSGIYMLDLATISGSPVIELYKQYPNLTSNNVRYLNGSGNYLCSVTLSGVDRYNLETDSRKHVYVVGANKCFQTSTGDFYFDIYTDLIAMYNNNNSFMYTAEKGNILQSYGTYATENVYVIHDMFITVGTSSYNNANTIFLATAHGVVVIEEKRGDEENARRRYYITQQLNEV